MLEALGGANADARRRAERRGLDVQAFWRDNGGAWWDQRERGDDERRRWCRALNTLPLAITLDTACGPIGIVHALPCPGPWRETVRRCGIWNDHKARTRMLWGTLALGEAEPLGMKSGAAGEPRAIIAGHFPSDTPRTNGRVIHIDTGAGLDVPHARVTLACVSADPITYHSSAAGDARVWMPPPRDGTEDALAPAPWLARMALQAIARWWSGRRK